MEWPLVKGYFLWGGEWYFEVNGYTFIYRGAEPPVNLDWMAENEVHKEFFNKFLMKNERSFVKEKVLFLKKYDIFLK